MPSALGLINYRNGQAKFERICVLFDSGTAKSIILKHFVQKCKIHKDDQTKFNARGGVHATSGKCTTQFYFPEFNDRKGVEFEPMVDSTMNLEDTCCVMIVGGNTMSELKMDIWHLLNSIEWGKDGPQ